MDVYEAIRGRRSIRRFQPQEIETEILERVLEAAHWAPYGTGQDERHFVVLSGDMKRAFVDYLRRRVEQLLPALQEASPPRVLALARSVLPAVESAPVVVLAYAELSEGGPLLSIASLAGAVQNLLLAAHAEGLAGCWLTGGTYLADDIAEFLHVDRMRLAGMIPLGYPERRPREAPPRALHVYWRGFADRPEHDLPETPGGTERMVAPEAPAAVLVVDDTPGELEFLSSSLGQAGYRVLRCAGAGEALRMARAQRPDLVVSDALMPGMTGYQLARALNEQIPDLLPMLIAATSYTTDDEVYALEVGADAVIEKPVRAYALVARVESLLRTKRLYDQVQAQKDELARINAELRELQEAQESLTHLIVHDLRTPLTSILGALNLVEDSEYDPELTTEMVHMAHRAGETLLGLINDLLDVAKMESGELEVDLEPVAVGGIFDHVRTLVTGTAREKGLELIVHMPEPDLRVRADPDLLKRALTNLAGNAVKFTVEGSVTMRAQADESGREVALSVEDTGPGIPEEARERIFEKFGQVERGPGTPRTGTGLGLAFVKMAAEAMGGGVGLESEIGRGSVFTVYLPASPPPGAEQDDQR